jgi:hypothetical protein
MRWAGHVARIGGGRRRRRSVYVFGGKARRKEKARKTKT